MTTVTENQQANLFKMNQDLQSDNLECEAHAECRLTKRPIFDSFEYVSPDQVNKFPAVLHSAWDRMAKSTPVQPNLFVETVIEWELNDLYKKIRDANLTIRSLNCKTNRLNKAASITQKHNEWQRNYIESLRNSEDLQYWSSHSMSLQTRFHHFKGIALTHFPSADVKIKAPEKTKRSVQARFGKGGTWRSSCEMAPGRFGYGSIWSSNSEARSNGTDIVDFMAQHGYETPYGSSYNTRPLENVATRDSCPRISPFPLDAFELDGEFFTADTTDKRTNVPIEPEHTSVKCKHPHRCSDDTKDFKAILQSLKRPKSPFQLDEEFFTSDSFDAQREAAIRCPKSPFELDKEFFTAELIEKQRRVSSTSAVIDTQREVSINRLKSPFELDKEFFTSNLIDTQRGAFIERPKSPFELDREFFTSNLTEEQRGVSIERAPGCGNFKQPQVYPNVPGLQDAAQHLKHHKLPSELDEKTFPSGLVGKQAPAIIKRPKSPFELDEEFFTFNLIEKRRKSPTEQPVGSKVQPLSDINGASSGKKPLIDGSKNDTAFVYSKFECSQRDDEMANFVPAGFDQAALQSNDDEKRMAPALSLAKEIETLFTAIEAYKRRIRTELADALEEPQYITLLAILAGDVREKIMWHYIANIIREHLKRPPPVTKKLTRKLLQWFVDNPVRLPKPTPKPNAFDLACENFLQAYRRHRTNHAHRSDTDRYCERCEYFRTQLCLRDVVKADFLTEPRKKAYVAINKFLEHRKERLSEETLKHLKSKSPMLRSLASAFFSKCARIQSI